NGLRAHEVPVDWSDDPDSRVDVARTAAADLRGMVRMAWALATGRGRVPELRDRRVPSQGVTRAGAHGPIGLLSYLVLFLVLRKATSLWMANFFSLAAVSVAAGVTHLLPRLTRRSSGYPGMSPSVAALGSSCAYLALTTLCLLTAQAVFPGSWVGEVVAISLGAALGAAARSLALRALAFRSYLLSAGSQRALSPARAQRATMR
ncbi:MAG TPA: hypothetical protein VK425_01970, partial [Acidimicrobiales bacterium]|nr:hypothetical protein [Acidimicrobiales bacterium]